MGTSNQTEELKTGMYIYGQYVGTRVEEKVVKGTGEVKKTVLLGVSIPVKNGFNGETSIIEIRLSQAQTNDGVTTSFHPYIEKTVGFPVWINSRAWKERVYSDYFLDSSRKIDVSNNLQHLKKVSNN